MADFRRGDDHDISRAGRRQCLARRDRIGIQSVGVGSWQSGVSDVRSKFDRSK
jgi:hypothetical protein